MVEAIIKSPIPNEPDQAQIAVDGAGHLYGEIRSLEVKAICPDGSHVKLMCFPSRLNKKCRGITPVAG